MAAEDTRKAALNFLNKLSGGKKTLDRLLEDDVALQENLPHRERAFFYTLVYGVLRWQGRLDWIIRHYSRTPLHKIDRKVLSVLRLGLFQIVFLDRVPDSAAVNTAVEIAKSFAPPWVVRYVNALLRKMAEGYQTVPYPDEGVEPVRALAVKKSFPMWLLDRWLKRFGREETGAICDAINTIPPITLRVNSLKTDRQTLIGSLNKEAEKITRTDYSPGGVCLYRLKTPLPEMISFRKGWFQVQDEAAQLVTFLMNPKPGETVLDACAGLGVKTGHIAQMMKNSGRLLAVDRDGQKLQQIVSEMSRLGVGIVETRCLDLDSPVNEKTTGVFDRILVDAPCSGMGVLRRNPDAKWSSHEKDLGRFHARQLLFLQNLGGLVRPGGILTYAVCSMEAEENEDVINAFLNNNRKFVIDKNPEGLPPKARVLLNRNGYLKTFPHIGNMDGFFSIRLRRLN